METQLFRLENFIEPHEKFHLARVKIHSRQDLSLHRHDYAEIFWIENGKGFHLINGQRIKLKQGDLVMIRPDDDHTFTSSKEGLTLMNLAFRLETLRYFKNRYFADSESYFWTRADLPYQISFDKPLIQRISQRAEESLKFERTDLQLDSLLLFIFRQIQSRVKIHFKDKEDVPEWLVKAIHSFNSPDHFKEGASGFATVCERNIDHVNRVVRKGLGKTLTELVTELRMDLASKQLTITNAPIKTICNDCGFDNLGHFYSVFKKKYQQTPAQYRKMHQTIC